MKKLILVLILAMLASCEQYRQFPECPKHEKVLAQPETGGVFIYCTKCKRHLERIQ